MANQTFNPILLNAVPQSCSQTRLANGLQLVLESPQIPTYISLILLYKFGVGHETVKGSGYLQWLKHSVSNYLAETPKVLNNTMIEYDRETFTVRMACMSYQVEEFLETAFKALRRENLSRAVLETMEYDEDQDNNIKELLHQAAYGRTGKGKPLGGLLASFEHRDELLNEGTRLHEEFMHPENLMLAVSGIYNTALFQRLLEEKSALLENPAGSATARSKTIWPVEDKYLGDRVFVERQSPKKLIHFDEKDLEADQVAIVFPTKGNSDRSFFALFILETLIGESSYFSSGGPGKGMHALAVRMLHDCNPSTHVHTYMQAFNNQGLFGLIFKGTAGSSRELYQHLIANIKSLPAKITRAEFDKAKNMTRSKILMNLEGQHSRIEEIAVNSLNFGGQISVKEYNENINRVSYDELMNVVRDLLKQRPSLAAIGDFEWLQKQELPSFI